MTENEELFRSLIENSRDVIAIMRPDGTIVHVSPSIQVLGGFRPEELVGQNAFQRVHPDDVPTLQARLREVLEGRAGDVPVPMPFRFRTKDGSWRLFEVVSSDGRANPSVGGLILNLRDITERKRAEESIQKLLLAVEQAENVVLMTDANGVLTYVNPSFTKTYGYSREETLGKTPRILRSGRHDHAFYARFWKRLLAGESVQEEFVNRRQDGALVTVEASVSPVLDTQGRRIGFIAVQNDVTQRKVLEEQFRQAQKMEAIGQLAGGVAHDFNNLLTAIMGYSDLLAAQVGEHPSLLESVDEIRKAGERATSLTRQLLAFSRRQVLEPKVLDLNALIVNLEKMLRRLIGEDVQLITSLDPEVGRVRADAGQIEQVILNLAVNARDAMPRGGTLSIETQEVELDETYAQEHMKVRPGTYVMFAVTDTGTGMSAETKSHIFEPFFTTKGKGKGTGLGLATVYGIVKQSGGSIWAYSELNRGTSLKIYLPRVEEAAEIPKARPARLTPTGTETVLLVEDEESVRTLSRRILEGQGYSVLEAASTDEALQHARQHRGPIHLVLTDVVMPEMGGSILAARIAAIRPEMKVIYMSGYTDDAIVRQGLVAEGVRFLQKPFTSDALASKVREVLSRA